MKTDKDIQYPLDWVDNFICEIKPHVFVREYDNLLILLPNQSYKLNNTGIQIMKRMLKGETISQLTKGKNLSFEVQRDLFNFFMGIVAMFKECLGEGRGRPEVEHVAYQRPYNKLPVLSEIALTYKCNLRCTFCYAGCNRNEKSDELSTEQFKEILKKIRYEALVPSVSFTGGEPTLRPDLCELVAFARENDLRVNLVSNGTLITSNLAEGLKKAGLCSAQISIEGHNAELHDSLTDCKGAFEKAINGIKYLKSQGVPVHHNTTLTSENLPYAHKMVDLAKELEIDRLSMNMIIPSAWIKEHKPDLMLNYSDIGETVLKVKAVARKASIRFMWYSPTPYCMFNPIAHNLGNKGCAACDGLLSIDPCGQIIPCSSFFAPQGSMFSDSFLQVWQSKSAQKIRDKSLAPKACKDCQEFDLCEGACPLYWMNKGCEELTIVQKNKQEQLICQAQE